ncbi:MAG: ATP-dependent RecD-like DNA helicase [Proteobacteria bacterium]|nr:ATP-dependent RecD-like DNA helicase [Pseudomonadota bacterium]
MTLHARSEDDIITATVESVLYQRPDGTYSVTRVRREPDGAEAVVVGSLGQITPGETLRLRGRWQQHATYGRRFVAASFTPVQPSNKKGVARYLGSGLVPNIGPALAQRLVEHFGDQTFDVIAQHSERLCEVPGIGQRRAAAIAKAVRSRQREAEVFSFLHGLGLGPGLANRVHRRYGRDTVRVLRDDPYLAAEQVPGIGFKTADQLGLAAGYTLDDPRRAEAAVLHLVGRAIDQGHVFSNAAQLEADGRELQVTAQAIRNALQTLASREMVMLEGEAVYATPLHRAEVQVARKLRQLASRRPRMGDAEKSLRLDDQDLAAAQREAVDATLGHQLLVLTGGPGTGKTTTVRAIVRVHASLERRVRLCAPTGRAAKRLSETTGTEAMTVHRLLEFNPANGTFQRNKHAPVEADLLLVDEASMLDLLLCQQLLAALPRRCCLVLVGDVDQLPPVGAGQVLRDLIASEVCRVVRLTEVFRQARESAIVIGAHAMLAGRTPRFTPVGARTSGDLFWVPAHDPEHVQRRLLASLRRAQDAYQLDPVRDVQVLAPMRKGPVGTERLNAVLQRTLNPTASDTASSGGAQAAFRAGDKVMQLRNDYEREVFNGDLGKVVEVKSGVTFVDMAGRRVAFDREALDSLTLAYASTIHKVQGSEFPAVIVVLHATHFVLLSRALLYTAITRARRLVVLIGDERALARAIGNDVVYQSNSRLLQRLSAALD